MGINHSSSTLSERETNFIIQLQENWVIDKKVKTLNQPNYQKQFLLLPIRTAENYM